MFNLPNIDWSLGGCLGKKLMQFPVWVCVCVRMTCGVYREYQGFMRNLSKSSKMMFLVSLATFKVSNFFRGISKNQLKQKLNCQIKLSKTLIQMICLCICLRIESLVGGLKVFQYDCVCGCQKKYLWRKVKWNNFTRYHFAAPNVYWCCQKNAAQRKRWKEDDRT